MRLRVTYFRQLSHLTVLLLVALAASVLSLAAGPAAQKYLVYVGTYTNHGSKGIYAYRFDSSTGKLTSLGLAVEVFDGEGERIQFGKEETEERVSALGGGLMDGEQPADRSRASLKERFARGERISAGRGGERPSRRGAPRGSGR